MGIEKQPQRPARIATVMASCPTARLARRAKASARSKVDRCSHLAAARSGRRWRTTPIREQPVVAGKATPIIASNPFLTLQLSSTRCPLKSLDTDSSGRGQLERLSMMCRGNDALRPAMWCRWNSTEQTASCRGRGRCCRRAVRKRSERPLFLLEPSNPAGSYWLRTLIVP